MNEKKEKIGVGKIVHPRLMNINSMPYEDRTVPMKTVNLVLNRHFRKRVSIHHKEVSMQTYNRVSAHCREFVTMLGNMMKISNSTWYTRVLSWMLIIKTNSFFSARECNTIFINLVLNGSLRRPIFFK